MEEKEMYCRWSFLSDDYIYNENDDSCEADLMKVKTACKGNFLWLASACINDISSMNPIDYRFCPLCGKEIKSVILVDI